MSRYEFESELHFPPPRPLPPWIGESPYIERQTRAIALTAAVGVLCIGFAQAAWIKRLGLYVLPLAHIDLIGAGLLLIALVRSGSRILRRGLLRYLVHGSPIAVEIVSLAKVPTVRVNGVDARYAIAAEVMFTHPVHGTSTRQVTMSEDFLADNRDRYTTSCRVGDRVTALYLRSGVERSLKLYGFLGLNPQRNFLVDSHSHARRRSYLNLAIQVVVLGFFFSLLIANVYAITFYPPLDFQWAQLFPRYLLGSFLFVLTLGLVLYRTHRQAKREWAARQRSLEQRKEPFEHTYDSLWERRGIEGFLLRAVLFVGTPFLVALTALCVAFIANAHLDRSHPQTYEVEVTRLVEELHNGIIREYSVEFLSPFTHKKSEFATDPDGLRRLMNSNDEVVPAEAEILEGYFGWRWVREVRPRQIRAEEKL